MRDSRTILTNFNRKPLLIFNFRLNKKGKLVRTEQEQIRRQKVPLTKTPSRRETIEFFTVPFQGQIRRNDTTHSQINSVKRKPRLERMSRRKFKSTLSYVFSKSILNIRKPTFL